MLENLDNEQFSVEDLSAQLGISRSHLHRKLKLLKDKSVSQFIREVRLKEAKKLLSDEDLTAAEIAYRVGFHSNSYFHKCFYDYFGISPKDMRTTLYGENSVHYNVSVDLDAPLFTGDSKAKKLPVSHFPDVLKIYPIQKFFINHKTNLFKITFFSMILVLFGLMLFSQTSNNATKETSEKSIAVLPFENLSKLEENRFFADGIVDDLLNRLSSIEGFKVISRVSSEMYREKGTKSIRQIARELGVMYIVEGSVQRESNAARIIVQLIDARNDAHLWSKVFDRNINDLFKIQSEIAMKIATELNRYLTVEQTTNLKRNHTENIKAFEYYQLGRFHWNKRTRKGIMQSKGYFEQAIKEDTGYGLAYAGLADTYHLMAIFGYIDRKKGRDMAVKLATNALEKDSTLAEAHNVLGSIYTYLDWNWKAAEQEFLRAIELNPNYSSAHQYYAEFLNITGKNSEARKQINKALELDPLSFIIRHLSAKFYYCQGFHEEAFAENQRCHELNQDHPWVLITDFYFNRQVHNDQAAINGLKRYCSVTGKYDLNQIDSVYENSGLDGLIRWQISLTNDTYYKAEMYGFLGEDDHAMDLLERSFNDGTVQLHFTFHKPFKRLHSNPRFIALLQRMNLPQTETMFD